MEHLLRLFDDVGILQHATGSVPAREHGYCVDDVARALPVVAQFASVRPEGEWRRLPYRCLAFLHHAQENDNNGGLRNFMGYDRRWLDHAHSGDHVSRAIAGLSRFLDWVEDDGARLVATRLRSRLIASLPRDHTLHTCAYVLPALGPDDDDLARGMVAALEDAFSACSGPEWLWFDRSLTYDNARVPLALLSAGALLKRDDLVERGITTLNWYHDLIRRESFFRFPGTLGLLPGGDLDMSGDEQPLEAAAMVEAELVAHAATGDQSHREAAAQAFDWFTGRNRLGLPLADPETGGCGDGLFDGGVSVNRGAESTVAYISALLLIKGVPVNGARARA